MTYDDGGHQTSVTFDRAAAAEEFCASVNLIEAERTMAAFWIAPDCAGRARRIR